MPFRGTKSFWGAPPVAESQAFIKLENHVSNVLSKRLEYELGDLKSCENLKYLLQ